MNSLFSFDELAEIKSTEKVAKKVVKKKTEIKKVKREYKVIPEEKRVHFTRKAKNLENYDDFTNEKFPFSLNFYDFEVFKYDWMVVIINPVKKIQRIIVNESEELKKYFSKHKDEFWCGYNSKNYDTQIMKGILLGLNPKEVSDKIIEDHLKGFMIDERFNDKIIFDYDTAPGIVSLKQLEGFMGHNIKETSVPFDIERKLNMDEVKETMKYCLHDVRETIEVFRKTIFKFESQMDLINTFGLDTNLISLTQAQLTANILGCKKKERDDEFDLDFVDTLRLDKYKYVYDWFKKKSNRDYTKKFETVVCGVPHTFGWGGLHGCPVEPLHIKGKLFHVDVTSYYPSLMIVYDFLTRNCKSKKEYKKIYDKRVQLKKEGKKKEQAPYKIILNATYGICKDKHSKAFDPRMANNVCVNGQLLLLDLLEHLEGHCRIVQSNTDGLIVEVKDEKKKINEFYNVCNEWIERTKMGLGFDEIDEIWQKDVNNYIFRFSNGKLERKGAYVMELDDLSYDLPIVNEAIVKYLTEDKPVSETINECDELKKFQKIVTISSKYKLGFHNGKYLNDKTFRVFASNDRNDSYLGKCRYEGATIEKFANTPDHCFIFNDDVNGLKTLKKLDKRWYVKLAEKRLGDFGFSVSNFDRLL